MTNIQEEINSLLKLIQDWEDTDPAFLQNDLKELRHKIMYVHLRIEASLEILIGDYISEAFIAFLQGKGISDFKTASYTFRWDLQTLFDEMDFAKKVNIAMKIKKVDKDIKGKLFKVNDLRVIFSHPQAHQNEIQAFRNHQKYLETLKILVDGYKTINSVFIEREKKIKRAEG